MRTLLLKSVDCASDDRVASYRHKVGPSTLGDIVRDGGGAARSRVFPRGQHIAHQDDPSDVVVIIESGLAAVVRSDTDGIESTVALHTVGDLCNADDVLVGRPYGCSLRTLSDVTALRVARNDIVALHRRSELFRQSLTLNIAVMLTRAIAFSGCLAAPSVELRVERFGKFGAAHLTCLEDLRLTQTELAALLGVSREQLRIVLSRIRDRGGVVPLSRPGRL